LLLVVPVALATAHQAGALIVFTLALALNHSLRRSVGTTGTGPKISHEITRNDTENNSTRKQL
jgi:heme A synthase